MKDLTTYQCEDCLTRWQAEPETSRCWNCDREVTSIWHKYGF